MDQNTETKKTIAQIVTIVTTIWGAFVIILHFIMNKYDEYSYYLGTDSSAYLLMFIFSIPFGILGAKTAKNHSQTETATWMGAIVGVIFGSFLAIQCCVGFIAGSGGF